LRRRKDVELEKDAANAIEDASDNPQVAATKKDAGEVLRRCLGGLSPDHLEIVDIVY
jgi:RNA polymerase sigma-70 factor (ECF subfamily)